jgi:tetratricopeptide (TPR) repeat protein
MRRLILLAVAAAALAATQAALAQGPVPTTIRSSSLTVAQEQELNRRLGLLEVQLRSVAAETELRESAVRNIAVEIFGARPDLDFETYAALIESSARELRTYITTARARSEPDPASQALRVQAIAAAEDGRLSEAREIYDQLIAANRAARQSERDAEDLYDAADMAEAASLAFVAADFRDAARRYEAAAELAPAESTDRWLYRAYLGLSLREYGHRFGDTNSLQGAIEVLRELATTLPSRPDADAYRAEAQNSLGIALTQLSHLGGRRDELSEAVAAFRAALATLRRLGDQDRILGTELNLANALDELGSRGDPANIAEAVAIYRALRRRTPVGSDHWNLASINLGLSLLHTTRITGDSEPLREAAEVYRSALAVLSRDENPFQWATANDNLGLVLAELGKRDDATLLTRAVSFHRTALEIRSPSVAPALWATTQLHLGLALQAIGERGDRQALMEAVTVFRSILEVVSRTEMPLLWARTQNNLGNALSALGEAGDDEAFLEALAAYRSALEMYDRGTSPAQWAETHFNLAMTYRAMGARGDRSRFASAREAARDALAGFLDAGHEDGVRQARQLIRMLDAQ